MRLTKKEQKILQMIANWDKMPSSALAKHLKVTKSTIYNWARICRQNKIELPKRTKRIDWQKIKNQVQKYEQKTESSL